MDDRDRRRADADRRGTLVGVGMVVAEFAGFGLLLAPAWPAAAAVGGAVGVAVAGSLLTARVAAPMRGVAELREVHSLRRLRAVEGLLTPLTLVRSQEGEHCAYDHVVHRCDACACVRPCSRLGGRHRAEDRATGRFLVRGQGDVLLVDGHAAHFECSLTERMTSHFHHVNPGERVRIRGNLVETTELPDDVRSVLASLRDLPRVLVPRAGTAVLIEKLPPDAGR